MLNQFLVLGQVPGTNFQVTFNDFVAILCCLALTYIWHRNPRLIRFTLIKLEFWLAIFSLRFKQPAILIGRIS